MMTDSLSAAEKTRSPSDAVIPPGFPAEQHVAGHSQTTLSQQQANEIFALYSAHRYEEALGKTQALIALHHNLPLLHNLAGAIHKALGQSHQAIGSFRRAIALQPDRAEGHNNLGDALIRIDRHEDAIGSLAKAVSLKPDFAEAHNNLGIALLALRRFREAASSFKRATDLRPRYAAALNRLGEALSHTGEDERAEESFRMAVAAKPDFVEAHANLGRELVRLGRAREGAEACHRALALNPNYIPGFFILAAALDALDETYSAIACLDHVIKRDPANVDAHEALCDMLDRRGRWEALRQTLSQARRFCGETDPRILYRIAQQAHRNGDEATAHRYLAKLSEEDAAARLAKARSCLLDAIAGKAAATGA